MSIQKGNGDNMPAIIDRIIKIENSETTTFIKRQEKELARLKAIEFRKKQGKRVHKKSIIKDLQSSGILDSNGNLASPYCDYE